jgi:hypothetical protein
VVGNQKGTGRWLAVRTWVVEADTAGEARAAAASELGWPLTETDASLATEPASGHADEVGGSSPPRPTTSDNQRKSYNIITGLGCWVDVLWA